MQTPKETSVDEEANDMLPDLKDIHAVSTDVPAADFFRENLAKASRERPSTICLDARTTDLQVIIDWLAEFDRIEEEQYETSNNATPFSPYRVIVLPPEDQISAIPPEWAERDDLDWIEAPAADARDVPSIYRETAAASLKELFSTDPRAGLTQEPSPDALPLEAFMREDEKQEWRQRLRDLREGNEY